MKQMENVTLLKQSPITDWLKNLSILEIKSIVTIKDQVSRDIVNSMVQKCDNDINLLLGKGFQLNTINGIYMRSAYSYKENKQTKKKVERQFIDNLSVDRSDGNLISVRMQFIRSGLLKESMMLFSEDNHSLWFQAKDSHSFVEWIIYLLQNEITKAFMNRASLVFPIVGLFGYIDSILDNTSIVPRIRKIVNHLYEKQSKATKQKQKSTQKELQFVNSPQSQSLQLMRPQQNQLLNIVKSQPKSHPIEQFSIVINERQFLITQCLHHLINTNCSLAENVCEASWAARDTHRMQNKIVEVLRILRCNIEDEYEDHIFDLKGEQLRRIQQNSKPVRRGKKKRVESVQERSSQKEKRFGNVKLVEELKHEKQKQEQILEQKQTQTKQKNSGVIILKKQNFKDNSNGHQKEKERAVVKKQEPCYQKQQQLISKAKVNVLPKSDQISLHKQVAQRLNDNLQQYISMLKDTSNHFDKYRKMAYQLISESIKSIQLDCAWELVLFGSCSIDFALKQSDLDLTLRVEHSACTLMDLFDQFKTKSWIIQCHLYSSARVPIITMCINLAASCKMKPKEVNQNNVPQVKVDISLSTIDSIHQGISNTNYLKHLLDTHPSLRVTALLLKEVLRVNGLNKPFTGGIGSFVLVIMVYSILHCSDHLNGKDYFSQIMCIANFMQHDFEPFVTLITSVKMSKLAASADLDLNIEDPRTHCLLVTSAYKIKAIVTAFSRFRYSLSAVEEEFYKIGHNEKKKQKKIFFESMDSFMVNPVADI